MFKFLRLLCSIIGVFISQLLACDNDPNNSPPGNQGIQQGDQANQPANQQQPDNQQGNQNGDQNEKKDPRYYCTGWTDVSAGYQ